MLLRQQATPATPATAVTLVTPRSSPLPDRTEQLQVPQAVPPFPNFTPNLQLLYLASKHRIGTMVTKAHRRKCETARITRRRRKLSDSSGSTSVVPDGSDTERCKTAMSDFLTEGSIDDIDLSDDELFVETEEKVVKEDKYQRSYLHMCKKLRVNPSASFLKGLKDSRITLTNYELGPKGVKPCCIALALNPPVKCLELKGNNIGPLGASYVAELLSESLYITELCLADNRIGSDGARLLSKVLINNEIIKKVDLSGNGFEEQDAIYFADILRENQTLRELYLGHNCFREKGGETLGPSLVDNTNLEVLDLSWNHLRRKGAVAICEGIKNNIGLKTVNLAWNGLYQEGCKALNKALIVNRTLTELDVSCNRIDKRCLNELLKGLMKNESIVTFRVGQNPLTTDGAVAILKMLEKKPPVPLRVLDLAGQCVDNNFIRLLEKVRQTRPLEVSHGNLLRKDDDGGNQNNSGYIEGDPMMVLMEFMRLQNLRLVDLFVVLDTDGSKTLTRKEFREGLMKVSIPVSPEGLDRLINKLDADGDGEVDYSELIQGQKEHKRKLAKMTKKSKEENTDFEETEIGRINIQLKALIASRDAAKKEALSKKRTAFAGIVNKAMESNRKSRPSSGVQGLQATGKTDSRPQSPVVSVSGSGSTTPGGRLLRPLHDVRPSSTPLSKQSSGGISSGDRLRRALTPKPDLMQTGATLGANLGADLGWTPVSGLSSAGTSETGTPPGRRSPNV